MKGFIKKTTAIYISLATLALFSGLSLFPHYAYAAITRVASNNNTAVTSSLAITITSTTAGNFLYCQAFDATGGTTLGISDNKSSTYNQIFNQSTTCPNSGECGAWYVTNIQAGITTVTITGANDSLFGRCTEYSGVATTNPVDTNGTLTNAGANTWSSGTITTTNANDLLVGYDASWGGANVAQSGSWSTVGAADGFGSFQIIEGEQIVSSTQTNVANTGTGGTIANSAAIFSFKAAAGGGGTPSAPAADDSAWFQIL